MFFIIWSELSFQSLLAQLQNDLDNLKTENRQLSFKYWLKIFPHSCSGQVLLNERLSGLDGGEGDFIILQGDKRQVPFRIRRDQQIIGPFWLTHLGTDGHTKTDETSEKFQTAFDPPPSFLENHVADFATNRRQKWVCSLWRTVVYYMILFPMRCMLYNSSMWQLVENIP